CNPGDRRGYRSASGVYTRSPSRGRATPRPPRPRRRPPPRHLSFELVFFAVAFISATAQRVSGSVAACAETATSDTASAASIDFMGPPFASMRRLHACRTPGATGYCFFGAGRAPAASRAAAEAAAVVGVEVAALGGNIDRAVAAAHAPRASAAGRGRAAALRAEDGTHPAGGAGERPGRGPPHPPPEPPRPGGGAQPHGEGRMTPTSRGGQEKPLQSNERHGTVVVVVVETGQPVGQASQQLETFPTHAVPPLG